MSAQSRFSISLQPMVASPTGSFSNGYNTGLGGLITIGVPLNGQLSVTLSGGAIAFGMTHANKTMVTIPVTGGIRYYFMNDNASFNPYVLANAGIFFSSAPGYQSESNFGYGAGGGLLAKISSNIYFDATVTINSMTTKQSSSNYLGLAAGIKFVL